MDQSTSASRVPERDRALDGLRGFAALAVLSGHLVTHMGLLPFPTLGSSGVIVFFALSGYLVGRILWRVEPTAASYARFLRRRARRLAPVLLVVVLGTSVAMLGFAAAPLTLVARDAGVALLQVTAIGNAFGIDTAVILRPTWSLTVEWAFYLLGPVAIFTPRRLGLSARRTRGVLAAGALALYGLALPLSDLAFYHLPVANLGVLVAGAALAVGHEHRELHGPAPTKDPAYSAMAIVMLAIFVVLPGDPLSWGWKLAVLPGAAVAALVVVHGCWARVATSRLLAARWLRAVGIRAYSLYLWHLPVMWVVWVTMPASTAMTRAGIALLVIVPLVALSFEVLERPYLSSPSATRSAYLRHILAGHVRVRSGGVASTAHAR
ncbi:acyltransferase family protein [Oryzobacter telluris]|uniref:acyltransferase family protein n=1 Tax=Oryzobacter telluris TaxID=3149179 RepID=UPI00370DBC62